MKKNNQQSGFTLIEIAIVLLIVSILLGYTVAMFPIQQELKQYRNAKAEMEQILDAVTGFAQVNGYVPCPAWPNTGGISSGGGGTTNCTDYTGYAQGSARIGFVPVNTLGLHGDINDDSLLLDPWGNPYRYYVTDNDFDGDGNDDFAQPNELRETGLVDLNGDTYLDLDGSLVICDGASTDTDECAGSAYVVGNPDTSLAIPVYAGVPVVLLSMGKNWAETAVGDELENSGASETNTDLGMDNGPSGREYLLDTDSVFARPAGKRENYDDIVKWISSNTLFSKMIEADQLP